MSVLQKLMETVVQFMPDKPPDPLIHKHGYLGTPVSRVDGQRKVKGEARFAAEFEIKIWLMPFRSAARSPRVGLSQSTPPMPRGVPAS